MILASPPLARRDNPFLGLAYYSQEDAERFSGRDGEIEAVTNGILRTRTFVVYGRSGLGKTSLLQAGVFPRLVQEERNCLPIYVRTLEDPLLDLRRALVAQGKLESCDPESSDLAQLIERAGQKEEGGRDRLVVLVFDQFEEFFVRFADQPEPAGGLRQEEEVDRETRQKRVAQRIAFIEEMGRLAAASHLNLRLVFSLREDWIAEMDDFVRAIPEITRHTYRLLPLTSFGVRQTVAATLRRAGIDFDAGLISALVEALAEVSFDPAVLQVMGSELWDRAKERSGEGPVRLEVKDLQEVGDVKKVFQGFLDQISREIPEGELRRKIQTRAVLEALTTEKRTKRALSREALLEQYFAITPEELDKILERLYFHRLVRLDPRGESRWFELVHERLVELILRWLDSDLDFFNFRAARNLVRNSCSNPGWQQNPELLLNQGQLDGTVGPFKDLLLFNKEERLFLISSAVYRQSRELTFWAAMAGYDVSADLLDHFLDQKGSEEVRQRAAEAASRIGERAQHFAERCLEIALHDPSEAVRRSAARSFVDLASPEEFKRLAMILASPVARKMAIEVLVEVIDKERLPKGVRFGFFSLRLARKNLYKRQIRASQEAIQERGIQGSVTGLLAGLVWMATAGLMILHTALVEIFPEKGVGEPLSFLLFAALAFFFSPLIGSLVGYVASRKAAREALRTGLEGRLVSALVVGGIRNLFLFILALWALSWGILFLLKPIFDKAENAHSAMLVFTLLFWLLLFIFLGPALLARCAWPDIWSARRKHEAWLWGWIWSFGGSLLLPLVVWSRPEAQNLETLAFPSSLVDSGVLPSASMAMGFLVLIFSMASIGGLVSFAGLMSLSRTFPRASQAKFQPLGALPEEPTTVKRRLRKTFALVLLGSTSLLWFLAFRLDGLPLFSPRWTLESAQHVQFGWGLVDTYHLKFVIPALREGDAKRSAPRLVKLNFPSNWSAYFGGLGKIEPDQAFSFFSPTEIRLAFRAEGSSKMVHGDRFRVETDQLLELEGHNRPGLTVIRLARRGSAWSGVLPSLPSSMVYFLSHTLSGGAWCGNMRFIIDGFRQKGVEAPLPMFYCNDKFGKVQFDQTPAESSHQISVESWAPIVAWKSPSFSSGLLSVDGEHALAISEDRMKVYLWSGIRSGETTTIQAPRPLLNVALSRSGRRILMIFSDGSAQVREPGGATHPIPLPNSAEISFAGFSRDSSHVWGSLTDNTYFAWRIGEGGDIHYTNAKVNPDDQFIFHISDDATKVIILEGGSLRVWDEGRLLLSQGGFRDAEISPDGDHVAIVTNDNSARVLSLSSSSRPWELPKEEKIDTIYYSPSGEQVATMAADGLVKVWKVNSQEKPIVLKNSRDQGYIKFSTDGTLLTKMSPGICRVWNIAEGGLPSLVPFGEKQEEGEVATRVLARKRVVVLNTDGMVRIWTPRPPLNSGDLFLFLRTDNERRDSDR